MQDLCREKLILLYEKGFKYQSIADELKCSISTVTNEIKNLIKSGDLQKRRLYEEELDIEEFIVQYKNNLTVQQLADKFNYSYHKIEEVIKRLVEKNIIEKDRHLSGAKKKINEKLLIKLYNENLTYEEIAKILGCHKATVWRNVDKLIKEGKIKRRVLSINNDDLIEQYKKHNGSHIHLASIYSCSKMTITKRLRQLHDEGLLPEYGSYIKEHRAIAWNKLSAKIWS